MPFSELKQISDEIMFMGSKYDDTCEMQPLADYSGDVTEVDGKIFRALTANGYARLAANKDELNKINVFPIPDADTGNNMKVRQFN